MNSTMADGASERLDAQIADALFGQPGMSKMDVANRLRLLRGKGGPLLCGSCYGLGVIGYTSGQTPEQFEQGEYPCPDCADRQPVAAAVKDSLTFGGEQAVGEGWSGWATQYPGKMPKLYGAREIAEVNHHPDEGQRLIFLSEQPAQAVDLGSGVKAIAAERERQLQAEGFSREGDQQYQRGELARAATAYVQLAAMDLRDGGRNHIAWHGPAAAWPWAPEWWKPVDARRDLVRAGALIAAQIDLIDSKAVGK